MQFSISIWAIWCKPFANILLKIYCFFLIRNICYFHIYSSDLSCLMPFPELWKSLTLEEKKRVSEGDVASKSWKNLIFILNLQNLVHTFWQHFTKNPFIFMMKYWLIRAIPPTFSFFDALARTINFWPLKRKIGVWGKIAPSKAKKMQFSNSICVIWWIPSANNLLLIIYRENPLFISNNILSIFMSIPTPFPVLMALPELL